MFKYVKVLLDNYLHEYHADLEYLTRKWTLFYLKVLSQAAQKIKFFMKDFFSKCDQIRSFQSHLLNKINEKLHFLSSVRNPCFVNRLKLLPYFLKHSTQASRSGKVITHEFLTNRWNHRKYNPDIFLSPCQIESTIQSFLQSALWYDFTRYT